MIETISINILRIYWKNQDFIIERNTRIDYFMKNYFNLLLLIIFLGFASITGAQVNQNRIGIAVGTGFIYPQEKTMNHRFNSGGEVALAVETALLPATGTAWLFGGGEFAFHHFGRGNVAGMESFVATLFTQMDPLALLSEKQTPWKPRLGIGWGTFYNYVHPAVNGDKRDAFFGIFIPVGIGYQVTNSIQFRLSGRGYIATAQVGDFENLQSYYGLRLTAEYFLP